VLLSFSLFPPPQWDLLHFIPFPSILELFPEFYQLFPIFNNPLEPVLLSGIIKLNTRNDENFIDLFWDFQIIQNFMKFYDHLEVSLSFKFSRNFQFQILCQISRKATLNFFFTLILCVLSTLLKRN